MQATNKSALPKLEDLLENDWAGKKKPVNYLNYTKEKYNILTLQKHNDYYQNYQRRIPVYVREEPDWSKSLYKRKNNKVTRYNYIMCRNVQNLKKITPFHNNSKTIPRSSLYRSVERSRKPSENQSFIQSRGKPVANTSVNKTTIKGTETLPFIQKTQETQSKAAEIRKRSLSSYCGSKARKKTTPSVISGTTTEGMLKLTPAERLVKRAEQLARFMEGVKTEDGKELVKAYAKQLVEKMKASNITKEQMKIAISKPNEDLEKMIEEALGIKEEEKKEEENEKAEEESEGKLKEQTHFFIKIQGKDERTGEEDYRIVF
eukprot:TRINITY_DN47218_c0_g1_i1.p2 TRINITY_DN47218_c0_g1~~TRINITY_DN47218_c0_g1_i1.p2  ORF type:complete len:318 (-),score=47.49 TRINITY_DN47218_c0_g1_i1:2565-3518(-)